MNTNVQFGCMKNDDTKLAKGVQWTGCDTEDVVDVSLGVMNSDVRPEMNENVPTPTPPSANSEQHEKAQRIGAEVIEGGRKNCIMKNMRCEKQCCEG